jgi:endogenous inhibitor of DNA gyrase (YacG/DUF329 family)
MLEKRKNCIVCSNKLAGKRFIYCSDTCYKTRLSEIAHAKIHDRRKKIENNSCEICFKIYKPIRFVQKCCSVKCRKIKRDLYLANRRKKIKQVQCTICNKLFKQRNHLHFNCSAECRKIDFKQKERNTIRIRPNRQTGPVSKHEFTHFQLKNYSFDKMLLRQELEEATINYLKKNKITILPDSPASKIPSVGLTSLSIFGDEREFYKEAALGHVDADLLEIDNI